MVSRHGAHVLLYCSCVVIVCHVLVTAVVVLYDTLYLLACHCTVTCYSFVVSVLASVITMLITPLRLAVQQATVTSNQAPRT